MYFGGKLEIFSAETVLGTVSATHKPSFSMGDGRGVGVENVVTLRLDFDEPVAFDHAVQAVAPVVDFLTLVSGQQQVISDLAILVDSDDPDQPPHRLRTYESLGRYHQGVKNPPSDSYGMLMDPIRASDSFASVLCQWTSRHSDWKFARASFFRSFGSGSMYTADRLIRTANMFDLLPDSAVPATAVVPGLLQTATHWSRQLFRQLPNSPERNSVLGALGRVGKSTLKRKIRHRVSIIQQRLGDDAPRELETITDAAVDCRNYYVHGTRPKFDYESNLDQVMFFTNVLEFVFAISDLIRSSPGRKSETHPLH